MQKTLSLGFVYKQVVPTSLARSIYTICLNSIHLWLLQLFQYGVLNQAAGRDDIIAATLLLEANSCVIACVTEPDVGGSNIRHSANYQ